MFSKTQRIKLIGVFCFILGVISLINSISLTLFPYLLNEQGLEIPIKNTHTALWLGCIGIMVSSAYLSAGIFFLARKPFSLVLISIALTGSILYKTIPLFIINGFVGEFFNYCLTWNNLVSPAFDLLLLSAVFTLANSYSRGENKIPV